MVKGGSQTEVRPESREAGIEKESISHPVLLSVSLLEPFKLAWIEWKKVLLNNMCGTVIFLNSLL